MIFFFFDKCVILLQRIISGWRLMEYNQDIGNAGRPTARLNHHRFFNPIGGGSHIL